MTDKQPPKDIETNSPNRIGPNGLGHGPVDRITLLSNGVPIEYDHRALTHEICSNHLKCLEKQQSSKATKQQEIRRKLIALYVANEDEFAHKAPKQ